MLWADQSYWKICDLNVKEGLKTPLPFECSTKANMEVDI